MPTNSNWLSHWAFSDNTAARLKCNVEGCEVTFPYPPVRKAIHDHMLEKSNSDLDHAIGAKMLEQYKCVKCEWRMNKINWQAALFIHEYEEHGTREMSTLPGFTNLARAGKLDEGRFAQDVQKLIAYRTAQKLYKLDEFRDIFKGRLAPKPNHKEWLQHIYEKSYQHVPRDDQDNQNSDPWYKPPSGVERFLYPLILPSHGMDIVRKIVDLQQAYADGKL